MRAVLLWPGSMMRRYYCGGDLVSFLINLFRVVVMELLYTNVERFDNDYHKVARWCSSVKHDSSSDISPAPRVSDFNVSQSGLVDELEAFGCWHTLMVSISLIPAFIQDQRKQQGVCWGTELSNMVNTSLLGCCCLPKRTTNATRGCFSWRCTTSRRWRRRRGWKGGRGLSSILSGLLQASRLLPQHQLRRERSHFIRKPRSVCHIETGEGGKNSIQIKYVADVSVATNFCLWDVVRRYCMVLFKWPRHFW